MTIICFENNVLVNCSWDVWSQWTTCSTTCGSGKHNRIRNYKTVAQYGGLECEGERNEYKNCSNNPNCPGRECGKTTVNFESF